MKSSRRGRGVLATTGAILAVALIAAITVITGGRGEQPGPSRPPTPTLAPSPAPSLGPTLTPSPAPTLSPVPPTSTPSPSAQPHPAGLFGIGTLNWRGASHLRKDPHRGERPYTVRMPFMIAKIEASGVSVIGFQEFETPQARAFLAATGGRWGIVRGTLVDGAPDTRDAIAYRRDSWRVARERTVQILYAGNHPVRIPLVRLTARAGTAAAGHSIWVLNTHNPASVRFIGGTVASRAQDVRIEAVALRSLAARDRRTGVFLTGDMNAAAPFQGLFMRLAGRGWKSAVHPRAPHLIDHIMGGPGTAFAATTVDWSTRDNAHRYTDHPFVHTRVTALP